jgi:HlyD family secretion protein
LVLIAAGGAAFWWWSARQPRPVMWQGYAEADFVKVGPTQPGLLTSVNVARGDAVAAGALLFTQDDVDDLAARDQTARQLEQAEQQLANLQQGGKPTEIAQSEANLADAGATLARTVTDLARGEAQLPSGGVSKQTVDQLRAEHLSAQAKVDGMRAALAQMKAPMGREDEIAAQRASVAAFRAALPPPAGWRMCWRVRERRWRPAPPWCRCCRRTIFSSVFSSPRRRWRPCTRAMPWPSRATDAAPD